MCVNLKTFNESFRHWNEEQEEEKSLGWAFDFSPVEEDASVPEPPNDESDSLAH